MYTFGIVFSVGSQEGYNGAQACPWSPGRGMGTTYALGYARPLWHALATPPGGGRISREGRRKRAGWGRTQKYTGFQRVGALPYRRCL
jgi:hypothetical protein